MPSSRRYPSVRDIEEMVDDVWDGHIEPLSRAIVGFHEARWAAFDRLAREDGADFGMQDPDPIDAVLATIENIWLIAGVIFPEDCRRYAERQEAMARKAANVYVKKSIPGWMRKVVLERDAYRCQACGDHHDLTVDHRIPESKGGPTTPENLRTICRPCRRKDGEKVA